MIEFSVEKWRDIYPEMSLLLPDHWKEIALGHNKVPLDVDYKRYAALCDAGILNVVAARDEGKLVGYHVALVTPHLHYFSTMHCMVDVYYIKPSYRKGRNAIRFFKYVEATMKSLGVVKIITAVKLHTADGNSGKLFEYLGYKATETVFTKLI